MQPYIIDSHAHCGIQAKSDDQSFENYLSSISNSAIEGAVFFAPVMEIYNRFDFKSLNLFVSNLFDKSSCQGCRNMMFIYFAMGSNSSYKSI